MTLSWLKKPCFTSILIATFMALHMSTAVAGKYNPGNKTDTDATTNYAAVIKGTDIASITEDDDPDIDNLLETKGRLRISDRNSGEAKFKAETSYGSYGNLVIASKGHWYYAAKNSQSVIQNLNNGDTLTDRLTVASIDGTTHTIAITIKGVDEPVTTDTTVTEEPTPTNTAAIISGTDSGFVTEDLDSNNDGLLGRNGKLNITDSDAGEAAFIATTVNSNYGSITIDSTGNWFYGAINTLEAIQNLNANETLTDRLTVASIDGTTHPVVITIKGVDEPATTDTTVTEEPPVTEEPVVIAEPEPTPTNTAAIISGTDSGFVTEDLDSNNDGLLGRNGKLNISDSDAGEAAFIATTVNSNYGSITIDSAGNWFYGAINTLEAIQNLNANETLTDRLTIASIDGTTHPVVITIKGVDEPVSTDTTVTEEPVVTAEPEPEPTPTNTAAIISGTDSGFVTEDLDSNNDGLLGRNGKLNISDSDAGEAAFIATTVISNYGSIIIDSAGNWFYGAINTLEAIQNLNANETLTDRLTVASIDGTTHPVVITIKGVDEPATTDTTVTEEPPVIEEPVVTAEPTPTDDTAVADVSLSWTAPSEREDNTAISLSEIAGYKIYYGTTQGDYRSSINIDDNSADGHTFMDFPVGTYFFVITTYDMNGRESQYSSELSVSI